MFRQSKENSMPSQVNPDVSPKKAGRILRSPPMFRPRKQDVFSSQPRHFAQESRMLLRSTPMFRKTGCLLKLTVNPDVSLKKAGCPHEQIVSRSKTIMPNENTCTVNSTPRQWPAHCPAAAASVSKPVCWN